MPTKELVECVLPESRFTRVDCFYSIKGADDKRRCACPCVAGLVDKIKKLEKENENLKEKLAEIKSEL